MLNYAPDLDRVFQALADPGRRLMVERLSRGPASVTELGRPLDMSLAAVLQHVQLLEGSGLIRTEKLGRTRTCSVNPVALRSAESWIAERRTLTERRLDRLGEYLAETAGAPSDPGESTSQAGELTSPAAQPTSQPRQPTSPAAQPTSPVQSPGRGSSDRPFRNS